MVTVGTKRRFALRPTLIPGLYEDPSVHINFAHRFVAGLCLIAVSLIAGCARHSYTPTPLETSALVKDFHAAQSKDLADPAASTPDSLSRAALVRSPAVATAAAAARTRAAQIPLAGARPAPRVGVALERNSDEDPGDDSHWSTGLNLAIGISPVNKRRIRVEIADADLLQAHADWFAEIAGLRRRVASAALGLVLETERQAYLLKRQEMLGEAIEHAYDQANSGLSDATTWQLLKLEQHSAQLDAIDGMGARAQAAGNLAEALGIPLAAVAKIGLGLDNRPPPTLQQQQAEALALRHHPALLRQLARYDRAESELALAVARQYPDIEINPGYFFEQGDHIWSLLGGLVVPVFALHDKRIAAKAAARDEARHTYARTLSEVLSHVHSTFARYEAAALALTTASNVMQQVNEELLRLEQRADWSVNDLNIKMQVRLRQESLRNKLFELEVQRWLAYYELEHASGAFLRDPDVVAQALGDLGAAAGRDAGVKP